MLKPKHNILRGRRNMRRRFPLFAIFILLSASVLCASELCISSALAQNTGTMPRSSDNKSGRIHKNDDQEVTLPDDMRIKMAIAREENDYKKTLEDVEKLSGLSEEVAKVHVDHKQLSADDVKKLNTIEKL